MHKEAKEKRWTEAPPGHGTRPLENQSPSTLLISSSRDVQLRPLSERSRLIPLSNDLRETKKGAHVH